MVSKMKKLFFVIILISSVAFSQSPFPLVPIQQIQWVHPDSLRKADSLQTAGVAFNAANFPHWIEDSRYWHVPPLSATQYGDTVTVVGIVLNKPQMYALGNRYAVFIQDTAGGPWSGIIVLANDTTSPNTQATGIQVLDTGMVVKVVGRVEEFPNASSTGYTELFTVIPDPQTGQIIPIEVLDWKLSRPEPVEVRVSDLVKGNASATGGHQINFSNGEQWEDVYVIIKNVSVINRSGTVGGRWTWWIGDDSNNVIQVYDGSRYFRGGSGAYDPNWTPPPIGTKLKHIRGVIVGVGSGYAITPLYPGDVEILSYAPEINYAFTEPQKREPALPSSNDQVKIRVIVKSIDPEPGVVIDSVKLLYSVNYGGFNEVLMSKVRGDTLWEGIIPPQANGSLVRYFFKAWDSKGQYSQLPGDTSQNIYFYFVKDGELKIKDLQYTILKNGNTGFWDLRVKVYGIVTADTTDFPAESIPNAGSKEQLRVYIQDDTSAWSGIRLYGSKSYVAKRGDSVEVIGIVRERNNVTEIVVDSIRIIERGKPVYAPVIVRTGEVGNKPNGTEISEKWESMLVEFRNVSITDIDPDRNGGTFREFVVDDGTGPCRVNDDGAYKYSNYPADTSLGFKLLYVGNKISYLRGIFYFSFGNYKLEPRQDDDFGTVTKVVIAYNSEIPDKFELLQNYPNPFNPSTYIEYRLPRQSRVTLKVYDVLGREIATLVDEVQNAGSYRVKFENSQISSGVYFYVLKAGNFVDVKKMILLK